MLLEISDDDLIDAVLERGLLPQLTSEILSRSLEKKLQFMVKAFDGMDIFDKQELVRRMSQRFPDYFKAC